MRPSTDEFVHSRAGWRSEALGFSIEVRWGGFSTEEPNGHWWWSVMVCEDQLSVSGFTKVRAEANAMMDGNYLDAVEIIHQTRSTRDGVFTDVRYVKLSRRAEGQSAALAEGEARTFCSLLLSKFPNRKVWDEGQKRYVNEVNRQEK